MIWLTLLFSIYAFISGWLIRDNMRNIEILEEEIENIKYPFK